MAPPSLPKPKPETDPLPGSLGATVATSSSPSSGNSDVVSAEHTSDDTEGHQTGTSQCKGGGDCQKFSSFLDTFDNLADFGTLHDSLENGDSYNSFLSEIYS